MITHIIFDIDDTLMDYYTAEMNVTRALFAENGVECTQEKLDESWKMSWFYWDKEHLSDTDLPEVQRDYHTRYHRGVLTHCAELAEKHGFKMKGEETYQRFNALFAKQITLYDDALAVLDALGNDRYKGWFMQPDGSYTRCGRQPGSASQDVLYHFFTQQCIPPQPVQKRSWIHRLLLWRKK